MPPKPTRDRDKIIAFITTAGEAMHGEGYGLNESQYKNGRDRAKFPGPNATYRIITGVTIGATNKRIGRDRWDLMLESIGLKYPPALKSGTQAAKAKLEGLTMRKAPIERVEMADHGRKPSPQKHADWLNTFDWEPKTVYIRGRRRTVEAARCW